LFKLHVDDCSKQVFLFLIILELEYLHTFRFLALWSLHSHLQLFETHHNFSPCFCVFSNELLEFSFYLMFRGGRRSQMLALLEI
jgi:hypothetical protein